MFMKNADVAMVLMTNGMIRERYLEVIGDWN